MCKILKDVQINSKNEYLILSCHRGEEMDHVDCLTIDEGRVSQYCLKISDHKLPSMKYL